MKKVLCLLLSLCFVSGCYNSVAVLGPMSGAANGKLVQSSVNTAINYGIKAKTGKTPLEHAFSGSSFNKKEVPNKPCVSFLESTTTEFCDVVKKNISDLYIKIAQQSKIKNLNK